MVADCCAACAAGFSVRVFDNSHPNWQAQPAMKTSLCTAAFWAALILAGQLRPQAAGLVQRVENTSLRMPLSPPAFGYATSNAFGSLTFTNPVAIVSPPGETNRLFVVEQDGWIAVVTNLANPTRSSG